MIKTILTTFILSFTFSFMLLPAKAQDELSENEKAIERHRNAVTNIQEVAKKFEARVFISNNNDTLLYRLLKPVNFNPDKSYPIVVCLSGSGGRGNDNVRQLAGCWPAQILSTQENRENYPCFLFVPQCPENMLWGISTPNDEGRFIPSIEDLVFEVLDQLEKEFYIDTSRRYITGLSMGGYGTWHYILRHPDLFAAAVPICGGGDPSLADRIMHIPIWTFHGDQDSAVPVQLSRDMIDSLTQAGGHPKYIEFKDIGHICWPLAYDTPGLIEWMFSQKNQSPTK